MSGGRQSESREESAVRREHPTAPEERCGYTFEASTVQNLGGVCCWRPVWGDADRCIWHADVAQKPTLELEDAVPAVGERLDGAIFRDVDLSGTEWLSGRALDGATFVNTNLQEADVEGADLRHAHFEGVDAKNANLREANLEHAEFDRTDLRGANLDGARLHYAVFTDVRIAESTAFGGNIVYEQRLGEYEGPDRREQYEAAHWTYRELQQLAENNGLTDVARNYYRRRKDIRRREAWDLGSYTSALAKETWRWTTGYGSNPWRVIVTSVLVIVVCAGLYPVTGGIQEVVEQTGTPIQYIVEDPEVSEWKWLLYVFGKSLYFSTVTFATLGFGDIQPLASVARAIAGIEALLGQLLMALLVFVLTRNVTWSE